MTKIEPNAKVTLEYTLFDEDGLVLDASEADDGQRIEYVHGYGMIVPGLEAALVGLREGEERDVVVRAEEGYGERDEELVFEVDREDFPDPASVRAGDEFVAESEDGEVAMEVVEVKDDVVIVDANHPLAGETLRYHVKVRSVRRATDEEIAHAAAEFEEAREEPDDSAERPSETRLLTLRPKKDTLN